MQETMWTRKIHLTSYKYTQLQRVSLPSGKRSMKGKPRSIGIYSTSDTKINFLKIGITWTRNGVNISWEKEEKLSLRLAVELVTPFSPLSTFSNIFVHACDFSPRAVDLVKTHKDYLETCVSAFVCDLTIDDLSKEISPSSVDIVTMCLLRRCIWSCRTLRKFSSQMVLYCFVTMLLEILLRKDSLARIK